MIIIKCKHCDKKFFLGFGFKRHLLKEHNIEITPNDKKYMRKMKIKFCFLPFLLLWRGLRLLLIAICFPFWALYDFLVYET